MPQSMPEYALTRNYLELMVELPWNKVQLTVWTSEQPEFCWIMIIMPWKN